MWFVYNFYFELLFSFMIEFPLHKDEHESFCRFFMRYGDSLPYVHGIENRKFSLIYMRVCIMRLGNLLMTFTLMYSLTKP